MKTTFLIHLFIYSNVVLLITLVILYIYSTNTTILKKKGFTDEFIKFKKKDHATRLIGMLFGIPVLELVAAFITYLIFGELDSSKHLMYIFVIFLILIIPFPIIDSIQTAKKQKELMIKTQSPVAADFKFKIFHSIFNPFLEIVSTLFILVFYITYYQYINPLIILHLALIWFLYAIIRYAKNMNKPSIREAYHYTFIFLVINHLVVIFHIISPIITNKECCYNSVMIKVGPVLAILLLMKLAYYFWNLPYVKKELQK